MATEPISLLLIEDSPEDAEAVRRVLAGSADPFQVQTANRLEEGLRQLDEAPCDVVLLDLTLPDSDGLETLSRVRSHAAHVPIVVLTSRQDEGLAVRAIREGAQDYLVKGCYDADILTRVLRYAIERKRFQETQLRQAQKLEAIGRLAAGIVHDINTPIQFINNNTHFLEEAFKELRALVGAYAALRDVLEHGGAATACLETVASAEDSADLESLEREIPLAIEQTLEGIERVATIARAMKDFSHPDKEEKQLGDLNTALQSTLAVAHSELKYVADVVTDLQPDLPLIPCYLGELNQVFLNLLVNSAHAIRDVVGDGSQGKGTVTVRTRQEDDSVLVAISDTGSGIPEEVRYRIFDPFFTTKEAGEGTGQGLSIARSIVVDKHGGSLTLETETGKGTTFFIRLPIGAGEAVSVPTKNVLLERLDRDLGRASGATFGMDAKRIRIPKKGIRILHIEDTEADVLRVRQMLPTIGFPFEVERADCLKAGLQRLGEGGFSAVLLDLGLPDSCGLETLNSARAHAPDVPIVVLTGVSDESLRSQAMIEGAEGFLVKDSTNADILGRVVLGAIARRETELALEASEARLQKVVEKNADAMLVVDHEGTVRFANPATETLFGRPAEHLVGSSFGFALTGGETTEIEVLGRETDPAMAEMRAVDVEWEGADARLVSMRDTTERKRAEEELKQRNAELDRSNKALDEFAYVVSHDLKEPLRGIRSYSQFLAEDYAHVLDEAGVAKLETLTRLCDRLGALIDSVLHYSRVGRQDLDIEGVDLNAVVEAVRENLLGALAESSASIRVPEPLPVVWCDRVLIEEVLQNLASNAIKYNDKPEKIIEIGAIQDAEQPTGNRTDAAGDSEGVWTIYVKDNGIGIPGHQIEKVFRIFKRLHGRDQFGGGTGIGLTVTRAIVERHGGRIWGESEPGEGTTFYFTLPGRANVDHHSVQTSTRC